MRSAVSIISTYFQKWPLASSEVFISSIKPHRLSEIALHKYDEHEAYLQY